MTQLVMRPPEMFTIPPLPHVEPLLCCATKQLLTVPAYRLTAMPGAEAVSKPLVIVNPVTSALAFVTVRIRFVYAGFRCKTVSAGPLKLWSVMFVATRISLVKA